MTKRLVLLGAPGAGKGTQAKLICEKLSIPTFSTGAMLRQHISDKTDLGLAAQEYISHGELVPDLVINPMVAQTLTEAQFENGFLADGYPRSVEQARYLTKVMKDLGISLDSVLNIDIDLDLVVDRLLKRAEIEHRADDTEPVIRHRMEVYRENSEPVVEYYRESGLLVEVDGNGSIEEVWAKIQELI